MLAFLAIAFADECAEPATSAGLVVAIEAAEGAWTLADPDGFAAALGEVKAQVPCLADPLTRALSARVHRLYGLGAFLARDHAAEVASFAAARAVQPGWQWPADLVPVDHPIRDDYVEQPLDAVAAARELPPPVDGTAWYDGREGNLRATARPTLHQRVGGDGAVLGTWYLRPEDPDPDYARVVPPSDPGRTPPPPPPPNPRRHAIWGLAAASGGAAVASGVLYASAAASHRSFDQATSPAELERIGQSINGRAYASFGAAGLAVASGLGAVLVARW